MQNRSASQRPLHTPSRCGPTNALTSGGGSSSTSNSSPDDAPLTVRTTRTVRRRRIIDSDDEDNVSPPAPSPVACISSPRRKLALRSPPATTLAQRPLQNLTNLPGAAGYGSILTFSASQSPRVAVQEGPGGKRGILELTTLLSAEVIGSPMFSAAANTSAQGATAAASSCTTGLVSQAAAALTPEATVAATTPMQTLPDAERPIASAAPMTAAAVAAEASPGCFGDNASSDDDDSEAPLTFMRSFRQPRTLRRKVLSDDDESDSYERAEPLGNEQGIAASQVEPAVVQAHSGGDARAQAAPPCGSAVPWDVQPISCPTSGQASQRSSLSFHSARSEGEGAASEGGGAAGAPGGVGCPKEAAETGQRQRQAGPAAAAPPPTRGPDAGPVHILARDFDYAGPDLAARPGPGGVQLAKVPRRRQGQRDGRDAAGEAAAAALSSTGGSRSDAVAGRGAAHASDGLMYDLYGELQLLSQLRGLSLVPDAASDNDSGSPDSPAGGEADQDVLGPEPPSPASSSPSPQPQRPPVLPPARGAGAAIAALEVLDLTLSTDSSGSSGSDDASSTSPSPSPSSDGELDAQGNGSSPGGLLDMYRQAQPVAPWRGAAAPSGVPERRSAGSTGAGGVGSALPNGGNAAGPDSGSGSDAELQVPLRPRWNRPPTTARRRAVVLDSSSSEEEEEEDTTPPSPQQQRQTLGVSERSSALQTEGCGVAGASSGAGGRGGADASAAGAAADALAALTLTGAGRRQRPSEAATPWARLGDPRTPAPAPMYDPYDIPGDDDDDVYVVGSGSSGEDEGDEADDGGDDLRDCSLQTPLPSFVPLFGTRGPGSGRIPVGGFGLTPPNRRPTPATPSLLQPPLSVGGPGPGLAGAVPTTTTWAGRKDQRRHEVTAPDSTLDAPSQQLLRTPAGGGGDTGRAKARPKARAPGTGAAAEQRAFVASRARMAQDLYDKWNSEVFGGRLPDDLPLIWNSRLTSTAGQVVAQRELVGVSRRVPAKLELSPRLIDCLEKLRNTLSHEMCHVAAWHISHEYDRPHGPAWEGWAQTFTRHDPSLVIRRTHDYITQYAHRWRCTATECGKEYGRQRQTIRVGVHVCAACHSQLEYLGHFDKNGKLKAPKATPAAAAGAAGGVCGGGHGAGGTAGKPLTEFAKFCKENFQAVRTTMPAKTPASAVFKTMGQLFQKQKANLAATAAAGGAGAPGGGSGGRRRGASGPGSPSTGPRGPVGRLSPSRGGEELLPRLMDLSLAED